MYMKYSSKINDFNMNEMRFLFKLNLDINKILQSLWLVYKCQSAVCHSSLQMTVDPISQISA